MIYKKRKKRRVKYIALPASLPSGLNKWQSRFHGVKLSPGESELTQTHPTRHPYILSSDMHARFPREEVGVGVVECGLIVAAGSN